MNKQETQTLIWWESQIINGGQFGLNSNLLFAGQ